MKGDDIFCVAREGICSRSNYSMQNIAVDLAKFYALCLHRRWVEQGTSNEIYQDQYALESFERYASVCLWQHQQ